MPEGTESDAQSLEGLFAAAIDPALPQGFQGGEARLEIDGFELIAKIGQGGSGSVWRAMQVSTGREVALKLLGIAGGAVPLSPALLAALAEENSEGFERFRREVAIVASLDHPNIAKVFESGLDRGMPYFAMELVVGAPLDQFVQAGGLDLQQTLELFSAVCGGVQHAHQNGVIHRDLKPSNILVAQASGEPKILDFGLAKAFAESSPDGQSIHGRLAGTPIFMSPEQASGSGRLDTRSDVYSLGVILYYLLSKRLPFSVEGGDMAIVRRVVNDEPAPASGVDVELRALLSKALTKDPELRYQNAGALADDIDRYLVGEPLEAKRPTVFYYLRKNAQRHRALWCASLVLFVVLLVGGVAYVGQLREAKHREQVLREKAQRERQVAELNAAKMAALAGRLQHRIAIDTIENVDYRSGLKQLAGALRVDPSNRQAAELAGNLLLHRRWPLQVPVPDEAELSPAKPDRGAPAVPLAGGASKVSRSVVRAYAESHQGSLLASLTWAGKLQWWERNSRRIVADPLEVGTEFDQIRVDREGRRALISGDSIDPIAFKLRPPAGLVSARRFEETVKGVSQTTDGEVDILFEGRQETWHLGTSDSPIAWDWRPLKARRPDRVKVEERFTFEIMDRADLVAFEELGIGVPSTTKCAAVPPGGGRYAVAHPLTVIEPGDEPMRRSVPAGMMDGVAEPVWFGFSPDGRYLLVASLYGEIRIWDIEGNRYKEVQMGGICSSVALDSTVPVAYLASWSGHVKAIDLTEGEVRWISAGLGKMTSVRHDPTAGVVLGLSLDGTLSTWSDRDGEAIARPFKVVGSSLWLNPESTGEEAGRVMVKDSRYGNRIWDWRAQVPLTPWFAEGMRPCLVADDWRSAVMIDGKDVAEFQFFVPSAPPPEWFIELLETVGGGRYHRSADQFLPFISEGDEYARLAAKFFGIRYQATH